MKLEIRVQAPGHYQLWVAENDTDWALHSGGKGFLTADEIHEAIAQGCARMGWELFPEEVAFLDGQRGVVGMPPDLWQRLRGLFLERELQRNHGH
jgi:hypothetical protein